MDQDKILLFGALGIGAYIFMTRSARARVVRPPVSPAASAAATNAVNNGSASNWRNAGNLLGGLLTKWGAGSGSGSSSAPGNVYGATAIGNDDTSGQPGYGWQYFSDGTTISPTGDYYSKGDLVWSPAQSDSVPANPVGDFW